MSERWSVERIAMTLRDYFPGSTGHEGRSRHFGRVLQHREYSVSWEGFGDTKDKVHIQVRGEGWADLPEAEGLELLRYLTVAHRFTASRFDLACDVPGITASDVEDRVTARAYRSRAREIVLTRTLKGAKPGGTVRFGSGASDRLLRAYDARGPLRIEVELKRGMASAAVAEVLRVRAFAPVWGSNVRAVVEFPDWAEWGEVTSC